MLLYILGGNVENINKKNILMVRALIIFLFVILLFLVYISVRNIYNTTTFYLNGEKVMNLELDSKYEEPGFVSTINGKNVKNKVRIISNVDTSKIGIYEVSYVLEYKTLFIKKILKRKIVVKDFVSPVINIDSEDEIYLYINEVYNMPVFNALDNIDGDITNRVRVHSDVDITKAGVYNITYSVKDSSNNETKKNIKVTVDAKNKLSYIRVSISEQKLYYYEKNKLVLITDIVTGMRGSSPTPRGTYSVLRKSRNVTLKGADYESFVSYWIAFKGNSYGLHDASWRSRFGGSIYTYNGSHGCVNMPRGEVSKLYNMVEIGTPVYIE